MHAMRFALRWCSGVFARADVVRIVVLGSHDLDAPAPLDFDEQRSGLREIGEVEIKSK